jgi:hypothetical protein
MKPPILSQLEFDDEDHDVAESMARAEREAKQMKVKKTRRAA